MTKKRIWKYVLITAGWFFSLGGLLFLMSFIAGKKAEVVCNSVKVYISGSQYFIDKEEVDHILEVNNNALIGSRMDIINTQDLENRLKANPFIEDAKVYAEMDGTIYVDLIQRQPVLRIMNHYRQDFYVDQHGLKIPLSTNFTARVLAANGFIDEMYTNKIDTMHTDIARQLFKAANFIKKDSLWDSQISQLYVNQQQEIELIPRVGNNRILIGNTDSLESKFKNLLLFYKKVIPRVGWDAYKIINIKYANQVIGVRNTAKGNDSLKMKKSIADSAKTKKGTSLIN